MPLVFVHGVNTRRGDTPEEIRVFDNRVAFFKEQFRQTAFSERVTAPDGLAVFAPYWGDLGISFRRNLACLPQKGVQALSIGSPESDPLYEANVLARLQPEDSGIAADAARAYRMAAVANLHSELTCLDLGTGEFLIHIV